MASAKVREQLAQDVGRWLTDGLIDAPLHAKLRERYGANQAGLAQLVRMVGIAGGALVAFGLLGLMAAASQSLSFSAVLLEGVGAGLLWLGLRLMRDPLGRYAMSAKAVLTLGVASVCGGIGLLLEILKIDTLVFTFGLIAVPLILTLAYVSRAGMLLTVGILGLFHWVGSWTQMEGRSTYSVDIQDPRLMLLAAAAAVGVGLWHELGLQRRTGRFYVIWEACGLIYLNLSLLLLTIFPGYPEMSGLREHPWPWIVLFAAAGVGQIVLGARLHNGLFTGFGVTVLVLNFYTRFYESFWDALPKGAFFLVGGAALLAAGLGFERVQRARRAKGPA